MVVLARCHQVIFSGYITARTSSSEGRITCIRKYGHPSGSLRGHDRPHAGATLSREPTETPRQEPAWGPENARAVESTRFIAPEYTSISTDGAYAHAPFYGLTMDSRTDGRPHRHRVVTSKARQLREEKASPTVPQYRGPIKRRPVAAQSGAKQRSLHQSIVVQLHGADDGPRTKKDATRAAKCITRDQLEALFGTSLLRAAQAVGVKSWPPAHLIHAHQSSTSCSSSPCSSSLCPLSSCSSSPWSSSPYSSSSCSSSLCSYCCVFRRFPVGLLLVEVYTRVESDCVSRGAHLLFFRLDRSGARSSRKSAAAMASPAGPRRQNTSATVATM